MLGLAGCRHGGEPALWQTGISAVTFVLSEKELLPHDLKRCLATITSCLLTDFKAILLALFSKSGSLSVKVGS